MRALSGLLAVTFWAGAGQLAAQDPHDPLAFLEPLIGTWASDPAWIADNPGMEDLVPISFRWGPSRHSIYDEAAIPILGQLYTVSLVVWNPSTRRADFIASQGEAGLAFTGFYESLENGAIRRTYDVSYRDGSVVAFRETFSFDGPDAFDWLTEWRQNGQWEPRRGDGTPEYRALRRVLGPRPDRLGISDWVGRWESAPGLVIELDPLTEGLGYVVRSAQGRSGVLVWDPYATGLRSVEVDAVGSVDRAAWSIDGQTLTRVVTRFDAYGHSDRWTEEWTRDPSAPCFDVTRLGDPTIQTRYCRSRDSRRGS